MQIKKLLKYLPIVVMATGLVVATCIPFNYSYSNNLQNIKNIKANATNVQTVNGVSEIIIEISNFSLSSFAIVKDAINGDFLYGWGDNLYGQLGIGNTTSPITTPQLCKASNFPNKAVITSVHSGTDYAVVIINGTEIFIAGSNSDGQQGNGLEGSTNILEFTSRMSGNISHISAGTGSILAVVDDKLYAWGNNDSGQLGDGTTINVNRPKEIDIPDGNINSITVTSLNSYLWIDNNIYAWGKSENGGTGIADAIDDITSPTLVELSSLNGGIITAFTAGYSSTYNAFGFAHVLFNNNKLYTWGDNDYGELGIDSNDHQLTPTEMTHLPPGNVKAIYSGRNFSAFRIDNDLYMSGDNWRGQQCNGTTNNTKKPTKMQNYLPNDLTKYSLFYFGGMAVTDGMTSFWGDNSSGTFGINTLTEINTRPVLFDTLGVSMLKSGTKNGDVIASEALKAINPSGTTIDKTVLAKYTDGVNSFPNGTVFTVSGDLPTADDVNGIISLTVSADRSYSSTTAFQINSPVDFSVFILVSSSISKTNITALPKYPTDIPIDKWINYIKIGDVVDRNKLAEFVSLTFVPNNAVFTITINEMEPISHVLDFEITSSKWIDSNNYEQNSLSESFKITLDFTTPAVDPVNDLQWRWIAIGAAASTLIGLAAWIAIEKRRINDNKPELLKDA